MIPGVLYETAGAGGGDGGASSIGRRNAASFIAW